MGKQSKKKAPVVTNTDSSGRKTNKPRKKRPKIFDAVKRRLVTKE